MKKKKKKKPSSREPILAAGGIVTRGQVRPLFAVVRLRRQKSWVLPKGKLNRNETALAAARREAIEETGHDMEVREFLGSLSYQTSGRPKTVRFWRMEASGRPVAKLMKDVSAVRWLPLSRAIAKLTHEREKEFLAKAGPHALSSLRRNRADVRPVSRAKHPPARTKRDARQVARKPSKNDRPVRKLYSAVPRRVGGPSCLPSGKPGTTGMASRQLMQTLWRWLGR
ncbi:MAG: NUDIX domain-containing protein [Pseudorhodoplanes sp.]